MPDPVDANGVQGDDHAPDTHGVRRATSRDLETLVRGNLALARETESLALDEPTVRAGVQAILDGGAAGRYYVLEEDAQVIAQLLVTFEWSDWRNRPVWWIASVYVPPRHRRRGTFSRLYRAVVARARNEAAGGVRLYVERNNIAAMRVYESLGMNGEHYTLYEQMFDEP